MRLLFQTEGALSQYPSPAQSQKQPRWLDRGLSPFTLTGEGQPTFLIFWSSPLPPLQCSQRSGEPTEPSHSLRNNIQIIGNIFEGRLNHEVRPGPFYFYDLTLGQNLDVCMAIQKLSVPINFSHGNEEMSYQQGPCPRASPHHCKGMPGRPPQEELQLSFRGTLPFLPALKLLSQSHLNSFFFF